MSHTCLLFPPLFWLCLGFSRVCPGPSLPNSVQKTRVSLGSLHGDLTQAEAEAKQANCALCAILRGSSHCPQPSVLCPGDASSSRPACGERRLRSSLSICVWLSPKQVYFRGAGLVQSCCADGGGREAQPADRKQNKADVPTEARRKVQLTLFLSHPVPS